MGRFYCICRYIVVNRVPALMDSTPTYALVTPDAQIGFLALVCFGIWLGSVAYVDIL